MRTLAALAALAIISASLAAAGQRQGGGLQPPRPVQPAAPTGSPAPAPSFGAPTTAQGLVAYWETRIRAVQAEVARDKEALTSAEGRYKAGLTPHTELADAQAQLARHQRELDEVLLAARSARLVAALVAPVTVEFRDAPVRQVARVLSDAAGIPVNVDPAVGKDLRLTAQAQRVPLASVLEAVGLQAHLLLAPDGAGITLRPWPSLSVDNRGTEYSVPYAPWSPEWGSLLSDWVLRYLGSASGLQGLRILTGPTPVPPVQLQQAIEPPAAAIGPPPGYTAAPAPVAPGTGLTLMPLGERSFVMVEPGKGPRGEAGAWLTVYQVDGQGLHQLGKTFHRAGGSPSLPSRTAPTPPSRPRRKTEAPTAPLPAGPYTTAPAPPSPAGGAPGVPAPVPPAPVAPVAPGGTPLTDAVREFNAKAAADPIGRSQPPLTVGEVVAAIGFTTSAPNGLPVDEAQLQAYRRVAETQQLPPGAELEVLTTFQPDGLHEFTAWSVRLAMPRGTSGGTYAFPIREQWIGSRALGPRELAVQHKWDEHWQRQGGMASFDRARFADEIAKARREDATATSRG